MESKTQISTRNLNLYYGENHALKNINLDLYEHKITAFIGPSGCGKSTYLKTLKGILDGDFASYPEAQARICRFVQEHRALARRPWAKRADRIKVETLLISKRLFYAVYGLGEWKNKHTVEK